MSPRRPSRALALLLVLWSAGGVALLFLQAIRRLAPRALEALDVPSVGHALAYAGCVAFLAYTEGYKAFHVQFIPRVVARTLALAREPRPLRVLLAPAFAMALFDASRRRLVVSWVVTLGVVVLILGVQQLPMPWRGMVDGGVVVSLGWGVARLVQLLVRAARGTLVPVDAELAEPAVPPALGTR
jgi:hypothetical protein